MITTNSFPNIVTSAPNNEELLKNSLSKEDLEGKVKKNIFISTNSNGGNCQNILL